MQPCSASAGIGELPRLGYTYWECQTEEYPMPKQRRNLSAAEKIASLRALALYPSG
jgi:hypothetical protein